MSTLKLPTFPEVAKEAKALGLSLPALARRADIDVGALYRWRDDVRIPSGTLIQKVIDALAREKRAPRIPRGRVSL